MKGTYLGEFQEIVLLIILILEDRAYGVSIQEEISKRLNRNISRGALHTALSRLQEKGFIKATFGEATPIRGGRRKKYYTLTKEGQLALEEARQIRESLWAAVPKLSFRSLF